MTRRRATPQQAAGDDSFLDIVANIVGILIILIVVAGVRASRAPVEFPETATDEPEPPPTEVVTPPSLATSFRVTAPEITDRTDEVTRLSDESAEVRGRLDETLETLSAVRRRTVETHEEIASVRKAQAGQRPDVGPTTSDCTCRCVFTKTVVRLRWSATCSATISARRGEAETVGRLCSRFRPRRST